MMQAAANGHNARILEAFDDPVLERWCILVQEEHRAHCFKERMQAWV